MSDTTTATATTPVTVTMYTTSTCSRCRVLARRLDKMGLTPETVVLDRIDPAVKTTIMDTFGITAVPLTIVDGLFDVPVYFTDISPSITMGIPNYIADNDIAIELADAPLDDTTYLPQGIEFKELTKLTVGEDSKLQL